MAALGGGRVFELTRFQVAAKKARASWRYWATFRRPKCLLYYPIGQIGGDSYEIHAITASKLVEELPEGVAACNATHVAVVAPTIEEGSTEPPPAENLTGSSMREAALRWGVNVSLSAPKQREAIQRQQGMAREVSLSYLPVNFIQALLKSASEFFLPFCGGGIVLCGALRSSYVGSLLRLG